MQLSYILIPYGTENGLFRPYLLAYGIRLWGSCAASKFQRVFRLQKRAAEYLNSKLKPRESGWDTFGNLQLLTLRCL